MKDLLHAALAEATALLARLGQFEPQMQRLAEAMMACWSRRGKVLTIGNGGSAADAMHFAEELVVRFQKNRPAMAAVALLDPTVLTCAANDFGYEQVFARQVEAQGNVGDILVAFSTSGNSPSVVNALQTARRRGLLTVGLLGRDGGACAALCDIAIIVPTQTTHRIQEAHQLLYHTLCQWVDRAVG